MVKATVGGYSSLLAFFLAVAVSGYWAFGNAVQVCTRGERAAALLLSMGVWRRMSRWRGAACWSPASVEACVGRRPCHACEVSSIALSPSRPPLGVPTPVHCAGPTQGIVLQSVGRPTWLVIAGYSCMVVNAIPGYLVRIPARCTCCIALVRLLGSWCAASFATCLPLAGRSQQLRCHWRACC